MSWYLAVLKKYAVFNGRARRKEYWMFYLVNVLIIIGLILLDDLLGLPQAADIGPLGGLYLVLVLLPAIAVGVRRLHDTGRSGWWLLLSIVPIIGPLVLLVFNVQDSAPGDNRYGANPKTAVAYPPRACVGHLERSVMTRQHVQRDRQPANRQAARARHRARRRGRLPFPPGARQGAHRRDAQAARRAAMMTSP